MNNLLSTEFSVNLKVGERAYIDKMNIKFISLENKKEKNFEKLIGTFEITENKNDKNKFFPEIRIYDQPEIITSEADILIDFYTDRFLVMNLINDEGYFNVRYQIKPLMIWIWISAILIALGGLIKIFVYTYGKKN